MDVNQTLCDFIKQQNIVIENNINTICYRDFVYYANLIDGKGEQPRPPLELYNSTSTSAGNTINLQKFIHYITTYYDCKEPINIDNVTCDNDCFSEELSVRMRRRREA